MKTKDEIIRRFEQEKLSWSHPNADRIDYYTQATVGWIEALAWVLDVEEKTDAWLDELD